MNPPISSASPSSESGSPTLYELYNELRREAAGKARKKIIEAIFRHDDFLSKFDEAVFEILKNRQQQVEIEELKQQTSFRIVKFLQRPNPKYRDEGAEHFNGWLWFLIWRSAHRAWWQCRRPPRAKLSPDAGFRPAEQLNSFAGETISWEDMLIAINQIEDPPTRSVMIDLSQELTIEESARDNGLTFARVRELRKRGKSEVRKMLVGSAGR